MNRSLVIALALLAATLAGCAQDKDSDADGLYDSVEKEGWLVTVDTMTERKTYMAYPDPSKRDTDGDGLSDFAEFFQIPATDPTNPDSDGDGLTDCQETSHTNRTECESDDFHGPFDGGYPTNPLWADSDPGRNILVNDIRGFKGPDGKPLEIEHGDGISDYDEIMGYEITYNGRTETITTGPLVADYDGDNLADGDELYFGSHPWISDSDGDGCRDGFDDNPAAPTTFHIGLEAFTLKKDFDTLGGADLRIYTLFHGQGQWNPASGSLKVQTGEREDISSLDPGPLTVDCALNPTPFLPWFPEVHLQFVVGDRDGNDEEPIQVQPVQRPVIWNLREGTFLVDGKSVANGGRVTLNGPDGILEFEPRFS